MDVWQDTTAGNGDRAQELGELLVISDGELNVSWNDSALLVVSGGVSGQLEHLGGEVLKDGSQVDWGTRSEAGGELPLLQVSADSSNWELKSCLGGLGHGLLSGLSLTLSSSAHRFSAFWVLWSSVSFARAPSLHFDLKNSLSLSLSSSSSSSSSP